MPIVLRWSSPYKGCLIVEYQEKVTWTDFHASIDDAHQRIADIPHTVDLIIWDKGGLPEGNPLIHFQRVHREQPPNMGTVVIVPTTIGIGMRTFMYRLAELTERLFPNKSSIKFARTLDEAMTMVEDHSKVGDRP